MSDSTNINNELDQYGVWVKNPPHTESLEDSLPDFSFLENTAAQDEQLTFENDDTALSADELLNITNSISTEEVAEETPAPEATDEVSLDDFMSDDFSIEEDKPASDAPAVPEEAAPSFDSMPDGEIDLDSFMDSSSASPDIPDGEVDLDSFMDSSSGSPDIPDGEVDLGAFFDSSDGPSLNHADGEINLDDFLGDSGLSSNPEPKAEEIVDEKPMDIDLSFDDSMVVETEEDGIGGSDTDFETITVEDTATGISEEVDLSDFDASFKDETPHDFKPELHSDTDTTEISADSFGSSEEIDLSDFGIEEDSGNQNVVMPGTGTPERKKAVIDYEMTVSTDDDSDTDDEEAELKSNSESSSSEEESVIIETVNIANTEDSFALDSFVPETEDIVTEEPAVEEQEAAVTPSVEEEISLDDFDFNDAPPAEESVEDTPVTEETPVFDETPVTEETPVFDETPVTEETPVFDETPVTEETPVFDETPVTEETPVFDETSVTEETPVFDETPVTEETQSTPESQEEIIFETPSETVDSTSSFAENSSLTEEVNLDDFTEPNTNFTEPAVETEDIQPEVIEDLNVPAQPVFNEVENIESKEIEEEEIEPSEFIPDTIETETLDINPDVEDTNSESSYTTSEIMDDNIYEGVDQTLPEEIASTIESKEQEAPAAAKEEIEMEDFEVQETPAANTVSVDNDILQKISEELSSLRHEINGLKNEFASIRTGVISAPAESNAVESIITEPVEESSGGFFADTDEDDTIAISGAELDNILTENAEEEQNGGFFSDSDEDDTIALSGSELDNILNNAEFSTENASEEEPSVNETVIEEQPAEEDVFIPEESIEEEFPADSEMTMDFEEQLEEPVLEETSQYEAENIEETEAEIDVPKSDDILVESDNTDLMDTQVTTDEPVAEEVQEEAVEEITELGDEPVVITEENPLPAPVDLFEDEKASPITDSNIDYLSEDSDFTPAEDISVPEETPVESKSDTIPGDMKEEIKSVLSYMDQLLENLPEDKITEFAQSEEFEIYKKLFVELGLA